MGDGNVNNGPFASGLPVNLGQMGNSLAGSSSVTINDGNALSYLTQDKDNSATKLNNDIINYTKRYPQYGRSAFYYDYYSNANLATSRNGLSNNQIIFGGGDRLSAFSQVGTWEIRNALYKARVYVTKEGKITIFYSINDKFDLTPGGRGAIYDCISSLVAPIYHDFLGGNPNMETHVNWSISNP